MDSSNSSNTSFKKDIRSIQSFAKLRKGLSFVWMRRIALSISDIFSITLAWLTAQILGTPTDSFLNTGESWKSLGLVLGISLSIFAARKLYRAGSYRRDYLSTFKAVSLSSILILLVSYLYSPNQFVSRSQFLLFWGFASLLVCLSRSFIDKVTRDLRRKGSICYPVLIVADASCQQQVIELVQKEQRYDISSVVYSEALDFYHRDDTFSQIQELGVAEVFAAWDTMKDRMFLGQRFQSLGITLHVVPLEENLLLQGAKLQLLNDCIPCVTFTPSTISGFDFWIKRLFDTIIAATALLLISPIYLLIAIVIHLDSKGPIFYGQTRIGLHGKPFKAWKFRSMVQNADRLQAQLEEMNQTKDGVLFKIKEDPRITRVGRFIRRYSLDELPQIFNVLVGEMSLVGPRPLPLRDVEKFQQRYFIRQDVLPGVTGLWQVSGRSNIDNFDDVLKLDLYYIQNWSIWLDLNILLRTFGAVLKKSGAY